MRRRGFWEGRELSEAGFTGFMGFTGLGGVGNRSSLLQKIVLEVGNRGLTARGVCVLFYGLTARGACLLLCIHFESLR